MLSKSKQFTFTELLLTLRERERETMGFQKESLDLVLVPCGLILMFVYHVVLLYRYLKYPETTVLGFENHTKRAWVERVMEVISLFFYSI